MVLEFYERQGEAALSNANFSYGAESFPKYISAPYRDMEDRLASLVKELNYKPKILDLCCGTGVHSIYPATLGCDVYGLDISSKCISAAKLLAHRNTVAHRCSFKVSDVSKIIGFEDGFFDCVICSGSLYYLDLNAILKEIQRVLKPGGRFIGIETYAGNPVMRVYRTLRYHTIKDRDVETLNQLLNCNDINLILSHFQSSSVHYFDFFTLFGTLLGKNINLADKYHQIARKIDSIVLNGGFRFLSFKFLIFGIKK